MIECAGDSGECGFAGAALRLGGAGGCLEEHSRLPGRRRKPADTGRAAVARPVALAGGKFEQAAAQDTYSRELDFRHTYEVPAFSDAKFAWRSGYSFLSAPAIHAQRFFAVEGHLDGLGYMVNSEGTEVSGAGDRCGS